MQQLGLRLLVHVPEAIVHCALTSTHARGRGPTSLQGDGGAGWRRRPIHQQIEDLCPGRGQGSGQGRDWEPELVGAGVKTIPVGRSARILCEVRSWGALGLLLRVRIPGPNLRRTASRQRFRAHRWAGRLCAEAWVLKGGWRWFRRGWVAIPGLQGQAPNRHRGRRAGPRSRLVALEIGAAAQPSRPAAVGLGLQASPSGGGRRAASVGAQSFFSSSRAPRASVSTPPPEAGHGPGRCSRGCARAMWRRRRVSRVMPNQQAAGRWGSQWGVPQPVEAVTRSGRCRGSCLPPAPSNPPGHGTFSISPSPSRSPLDGRCRH